MDLQSIQSLLILTEDKIKNETEEKVETEVTEKTAEAGKETPEKTPEAKAEEVAAESKPKEEKPKEAAAKSTKKETKDEEEIAEPVGSHDDYDWSINKRNVQQYSTNEISDLEDFYAGTFTTINENEIISGAVVFMKGYFHHD